MDGDDALRQNRVRTSDRRKCGGRILGQCTREVMTPQHVNACEYEKIGSVFRTSVLRVREGATASSGDHYVTCIGPMSPYMRSSDDFRKTVLRENLRHSNDLGGSADDYGDRLIFAMGLEAGPSGRNSSPLPCAFPESSSPKCVDEAWNSTAISSQVETHGCALAQEPPTLKKLPQYINCTCEVGVLGLVQPDRVSVSISRTLVVGS
ncbi:uncharacterized protein B0H18DRAFT_673350 [Fomitopsis serialis]|uniref:uncharacterized protein n=1 Tax=Fomitopsis serialis TaxID=139415 RepID=UPI002007BEAD|nr:uncharacterized protein B0H18DRAFT_673350 [Neoantrodia serialis]KAH9932973.1 hypothetical protein B0H18DRAFT_673350 [Neoantrodia serialis]